MNLGLKNRVAMIAAASKGIGKACALALAAEGCKVSICARNLLELDKARADIAQARAERPGLVAADVAEALYVYYGETDYARALEIVDRALAADAIKEFSRRELDGVAPPHRLAHTLEVVVEHRGLAVEQEPRERGVGLEEIEQVVSRERGEQVASAGGEHRHHGAVDLGKHRQREVQPHTVGIDLQPVGAEQPLPEMKRQLRYNLSMGDIDKLPACLGALQVG